MPKRLMLGTGVPGAVTEILQLGSSPGELVRISEPPFPVHLTCGIWKSEYHRFSSEVSGHAGSYVLATPPRDGKHLVYVGESKGLHCRMRGHDFAKEHLVSWFAILGSDYPVLNKVHAGLIEAHWHRMFANAEGVRMHKEPPPLSEVHAKDAFIVTQVLDFARRALRHSTLPETIRFKSPGVRAPVVELEGGKVLQLYQTYRFSPGPNCAYANVRAVLSDTSGGWLLHPGSELRVETSKGVPVSIRDRRAGLLRKGYLEEVPGDPSRRRFRFPVFFERQSIAAKVIAGYALNEPGIWVPIPSDLPKL